jgi:Tfp pilus assembly protein PilZ
MVNRLSEEQQILLLRHLDRSVLTAHLFKLIIDLSEEQQNQLLDQLNGMLSEEVPEKTITLDEREAPRRTCTIAVNFQAEGHSFQDTILDISAAGVFIKTDESLNVGQGITLRFSFPDAAEEDLDIVGEIVWRSPRGIGVKFFDLTPQHFERIKQFVDQP